MKPYTRFAEVYDLMGADRHSIKMVKYCQKIFEKFKIHPVNGLDLCCGTGTAINHLSKLGIIMSGLDQSPHMLAVAAKKLKSKKIKLYQKSLPKFKLLQNNDSTKIQQFDLVTSFFDSLNYLLTEKDLLAAFKSVHKHLNPGGWFIFDMNTQEALKYLWDEHVYADAKDDIAWVWKNEYLPKEKMALCHATFFIQVGKKYERFYEVHKERAYPNSKIKKMLRDAGFQLKGYYNCYSFNPADRETNRFCAIVKKKSK